jgi:hypothetical protein
MKHKKVIVVWRADRTIINSVFEFPPDRTITTFSPRDVVHKSRIAARTKMIFFDGELTITFDDNKVFIRQCGERQWNDLAVVYYLIYKTFLSYNWLSPENESTEIAKEVDRIAFKLHRYVTKYVERDGNTIPYTDTEPCEIILDKKDIENYLTVLDQAIGYSISYYLLGCDTQQYFLIEFYKCLEVIKNHFKNEKEMRKALCPHGFVEAVYRDVKKLANDRMKPLSISRHAPLKDISVYNIDTKWLFSDPMGRKTFETGERACRNLIDSYIQFRIAGKS